MNLIGKNIRLLRLRQKLSQENLAQDLCVSRSLLAKYESGKAEPPIAALKRISLHFNVSIDLLVMVDLSVVPEGKLMELEGNRVLLPIMVNREQREMVEIVTQQASAGYLNGFADPEFIEGLQALDIPMLGQGKFRAFQIKGDSMLPVQPGTFILARYVESQRDISEGKAYILLTRDEGIVYKQVKRMQDGLMLISTNPAYEPYPVKHEEVLEMWEDQWHLEKYDPAAARPGVDQLLVMLEQFKNELISGKSSR